MDCPDVCIEVVVMNYGSALLVREDMQNPEVKWCFPRTIQRKGETIQQAVDRAVREACGIKVEAANAINAYDQITDERHQVVINIEGRYVDGDFDCDNETKMAAWASGIALRSMDVEQTTLAILRNLGFVDW